MKKLFRNKPMATRNPIKNQASRKRTSPLIGVMGPVLVLVAVVVVLSLVERGSVL